MDGRPTDTSPYPIRILTLFPDMIRQAASHSIIERACAAGLLDIRAVDIRDWTYDRHKTADDQPFGGGPGMVMKPEPVAGGIKAMREELPGALVVLMSASGRMFDQETATRYAAHAPGLVLVCGHYEGVDERIAEFYCDEEICVGNYVLSGGELPALTVMDATARLIPGVLGNADSLQQESHDAMMLEYPQYTRPRDFEGHVVPEVLFSGNHAAIERFRQEAALRKTAANRPDLIPPTPPPSVPAAKTAPIGWGRPKEDK